MLSKPVLKPVLLERPVVSPAGSCAGNPRRGWHRRGRPIASRSAATLHRLVYAAVLIAATFVASEASARCVRLLRSNGWGDRIVCNNTGGGYRSGGGFNYGAAAAIGVGVISQIARAAERQRIDEENERIAESNRAIAAENARRAACNRNLDVAVAATNQGNAMLDRWDPAGAIRLYERAISTLAVCGHRKNTAILRRNIEIARKQYATIMPDNRVSDAQRQYANQNIYTAPNPFAPSASSAPGGAGRRPWSGLRDDCKLAGKLEQQTASWFNVCVWDGTRRAERYQPTIDPQKLSIRAKQECRSASEQELAECVVAAKTRIIMTEDADIRRKCSGAAEKLVECVDMLYVYGPRGHGDFLRASIAFKLAQLSGGAGNSPSSGPVVASGDRIATPEAADAATEEVTLVTPAMYQAAVREYQARRFDEVAAAAVQAAADSIDSGASAEDRRNCAATAFQAVRAQMAGGNPPVPAQCEALVDIARSRLAYYASIRVDTGPSPEDDPLKLYLASLNRTTNAPNDGKLGPGLVGLTPDERARAEGECLRGGETGESCARALDGSR